LSSHLPPTPSGDAFGILIVEDEAIVAHDLCGILESEGYRVVGPVDSGQSALELAATGAAQLALMDIQIRGELDGLAAARRLWAEFLVPSVFVTALSGHENVRRAGIPGVLGYIVKPFDIVQLSATVALARQRCFAEAQRWRDLWHRDAIADAYLKIAAEVEAVQRLMARIQGEAPPGELREPTAALSAREREVFRLLLSNHRVASIAGTLFISQHTVRNHLKAIYKKFGVGSQEALIELVRRDGVARL
jgi:DNA-binding NarL/FixJ family response regulator